MSNEQPIPTTDQVSHDEPANGERPTGPELNFRIGAYSAAIWRNSFENSDGTSRTTRSATIQRRFYNRNSNQWESSSLTVLNLAELSCLVRLLERLEQAVLELSGGTNSPF